ncbi:MAG: hypothetical protein ACI9D5_002929 [Candidatus Endobugula sp.]|jgi:hypothetical protein
MKCQAIKNIALIIFLCIGILIFSVQASDDVKSKKLDGFPDAPDGYSWVTFRGVAIPKPNSWFEFKKQGTYVTSIESVKEEGIFETGATIQVVRDVQDTYKNPASVVAIGMIRSLDESEENETLIIKHQDIGLFKTFTFRYRNAPLSAIPIIVHKFIMANDKESYINIITFESSEKEWDKYWDTQGITIFK